MKRAAGYLNAAMAVSALASLVSLGACATRPPASDPEALQEFDQTNDPLEPTNRFFYGVDDTLQRYTFKPAAQAYVAVTPAPVRNSLHNFIANLGSPVLLVDDVSQAKPKRATDTVMRFVINSTLGLAGFFDFAKGLGFPAHDSNFGVTLALWGIPSGPFLYLPIVGPSSVRGVTGFAVDQAVNPFDYVPTGLGLHTLNWATYVVGAVDTYSRIYKDYDREKAGALDPYATFRSLYRQYTKAEIEAARADQRGSQPAYYKQ
jgi:phospholipid-binding lipoprotein MlaA